MQEEKLIGSLQKGDTAALDRLIKQYNRYVSSIIGRIIGANRVADCEELTADVFLAVWNNRDKLQQGKIKSYLGKIARNRAFDLLRQDKDALPLEDDILIYDPLDIEEQAERADTGLLLKKALDKLDKRQRELFVRHYYYGQTIKEAAEAMDINLSTAKSWLYRGQAVLKEQLEQSGFTYP
ncbi:MAG: RNA polymerase sigma factor [[Eubacterium] siraeum]|nr:RNA polymerase sigma factor [[Eubacterium] siraeum]